DDDDDGGAQSDAGGDDDDEEVVAAAAADEEDALIMGNLREIITQALGTERCRAVLAALYVSRSDVSSMVRQAAFGVWKGIVSHTPRTARECLPAIMEIVLGGLSSEEYDRRTTAARTLGDLVHKLGEAVMSQIVPILETALREQDGAAGSARHGVFVGLSEILSATGRAHIEAYADAMIPLVRRGLCDEDEMVREAAATAFNGLQQTIGPRVIDSVVPPLLNALTQGAGGELDGIRPEHALEALRELMAVRANVVFPVLIPTLTAVPVSAFNARALSSLIQVAGAALGRRLPQILLALFKSFPVHQAAGDAEAEAALRDTVDAIAATAVHDDVALESLMIQLHESVKAGEATDLAASPADASRVAEACLAMGAICRAFGAGSAARGRTPLGAHVVDWLRILIDHLGASAAQVVEASWAALDALCRAVPRDDYDGYVGPISRAVQHATESLPRGQRTLPGFNLAKGVGPLLPIYSQGLLAGSPDTKERAVRGMARLVRFTEPDALRPFATGITGPLIRIVGDRHPPAVKAAILSTLGLLLVQIPALMRPFLPQLQRTFVRGLTEKEDVVRQRAAAALAALIPLQARLDPLVLELTSGVRQAETQGMRNAMMRAVCAVVQAPNAGALAPASIQAIEAAVVGRIDAVEAGDLRWQALRSRAFGGLCGVVDATAAAALVAQHATVDAADSGAAQEAKLYSLAAALAEAPRLFAGSAELQQRVVESVATALPAAGGQTRAALPAIQVAKAALLSREIAPSGSDIIAPLADALVAVVAADSAYAHDSDAQQAALRALKAAAKYRYADVVEPARVAVVQAAMAHVRDRIIPVKLAAERCALYALRLANVPPEGFEGSDAGLASYVDAVGGAASDRGKLVLDYQRRVLNKLADATRELDYASDDEDDPARAAAKDDAASDDDDGDAE
ncbi:translational activator of GCN4, partial [Coemansia nantahalensis]